MRTRVITLTVIIVIDIFCSSCGDGDEENSNLNSDGDNVISGASGGTDSPLPESAGSESAGSSKSCLISNQTRACLCGTSHGRQTCLESEWSDCECVSDDGGLATDKGGRLVGEGDSSDDTPEGNQREDLTFDWLRSVPLEGECKPGRYEGSYECTTNGPMGPGLMPEILVVGEVAITLEKSSKGEFLEIVDGSLEGVAENFAVPFTSKLDGQLDCATNEFEAFAVDGSYLLFVIEGAFHGDLVGDYNRLTSHLSGQWSLSDSLNENLTCIGPWSADYVAP